MIYPLRNEFQNEFCIIILAQPPTIVSDEMHVSAPEGSYATLKCSVRGIPTPVVSWRKDSNLIDGSGGRHKFLVDGSLQIIGLHSSDAGVYHCAANNGVGHPVQKEFTLEVTGIGNRTVG